MLRKPVVDFVDHAEDVECSLPDALSTSCEAADEKTSGLRPIRRGGKEVGGRESGASPCGCICLPDDDLLKAALQLAVTRYHDTLLMKIGRITRSLRLIKMVVSVTPHRDMFNACLQRHPL